MIIAVHRRLNARIWNEGIDGSLSQRIDSAGLLNRHAQAVSANFASQNTRFKVELVAVAITRMFAGGAAHALGYGVGRANI